MLATDRTDQRPITLIDGLLIPVCLVDDPNPTPGLTSTVELERALQRNPLARATGLRVRLLGRVERVHVRLVVLLVVQLHNLLRDEGLEAVVRVRQVREGVSTESSGGGHCFCSASCEGW